MDVPSTETTAPVTTPELPGEDEVMAFVHGKRMEVLDIMMKKGLPEDPAEVKTIVSILKDMDSQAIGRKRIKTEEKQNNNQEQAAGLIAQLLNAAAGTNPFKVTGAKRPTPTLGKEIPEPVLVNNETSTALQQNSYDDFIARNQAQLHDPA